MNAYNEKRQSLNLALREAARANDSEKMKALNNELSNLNLEATNFPFEFINNNRNNYYSLILLESMLKNRNANYQKIIDTYQNLMKVLKLQ